MLVTVTGKGPENSSEWRQGYLDARRSLFSDNGRSTRTRLDNMGVTGLDGVSLILDFGCGDGNLVRYLNDLGYMNVIGMEPDLKLLEDCGLYLKRRGFWTFACHELTRDILERVLERDADGCCGNRLPCADGSFDGIVSMAVLHHLQGEDAIRRMIREFYRILKPGGFLYYTEPSDTLIRRILTTVLLSPLGNITEFSRKKRLMVLDEYPTLNQWLNLEREMADKILVPAGFVIEKVRREPLKTFVRAMKPLKTGRGKL